MFNIIVLLVLQLLISISPLICMAEESVSHSQERHNNIFALYTENSEDEMLGEDEGLSLEILSVMASRDEPHILITIKRLKKIVTLLHKNLTGNSVLAPGVQQLIKSTYHIKNSPFCIILPEKKTHSLSPYNHQKFLDISECNLAFNKELMAIGDNNELLNQLVLAIKNLQEQLFCIEKNQQKKESDVIKQLFSKQISAHDLFSSSDNNHNDGRYTHELYEEATQPWHFIVSGHGVAKHSMAGFAFEQGELWKTLKLLNHISTGYLIIFSCSAGGINREILTGCHDFSSEDFSWYTTFEPIIKSLAPAYNIILYSSSDAQTLSTISKFISMVKEITTTELSEKKLLEIFNKNLFSYNKYIAANQLPLILRPGHTTFKPFIAKENNSTYNPRSALIDNQQITAVALHKHHAEKSALAIKEKEIIETDQTIITQDCIIEPTIDISIKSDDTNVTVNQKLTYGHEHHLIELFPVISDIHKKGFRHPNGTIYLQKPAYPFFLSLQVGDAYHYIKSIITKKSGSNLPGEQGLFLCLRDLFFNANTRSSTQLYFIKSITGENDIPQEIIDANLFGEYFPQSKEIITLEDVVITTSFNNPSENQRSGSHFISCAFSCQEIYYSFALKIEDETNEKEWCFIRQLASKEDFEQTVCTFEDFVCSKIYDRLESYPASHPQHDLIEQYLNREKSIFLHFEKSYPLFKDAHLPEDNRAWEKFPELLKKHAEKQKNLSSVAKYQRNNQEIFDHMMNKLKEDQDRKVFEPSLLNPTELFHNYNSHN